MKSNAILEQYLKTFIKNCVFANKQERLRLKLLPIDDNSWSDISHKLITYLDFKTCRELTSKEKSEENLVRTYKNRTGIYLDFESAPKSMMLSEAASIHFKDALFLLDEGNLVFFFTHHDDIYVCAKA